MTTKVKKLEFCLSFVFLAIVIYSQSLSLPLEIPPSLAGNYAELRKNHFHMGLDFRTENKENLNVIAAADGYVSRILISPNGYGKCIYINHPKLGITTVYAHLNEFSGEIQSWTDRAQYALKRNVIDTLLPADLIQIRKGDVIAKSGNTGSSGGPHLHFETRNILTERTINPLHYYPQILDKISPTLNKVILYQLGNSSKFLTSIDGKASQEKEVVVNSHSIGLAVSAMDKMDGSPNVFGIYGLKIYENEKLRYRFQLDSLDFNWQGHIKAASDYALGIQDVYKGFYELCSFNLTDSGSENGIVSLSNGERKSIRIEIYDFHGNVSRSNFYIIGGKDEEQGWKTPCSYEIVISDNKNFELTIPPKGLAESVERGYWLNPKLAKNEVLRLSVFSESTAVLKPYQFRFRGVVKESIRDKIYMESRVDNTHKAYVGKWYGNVMLFPKVKNYGVLSLKYDLIAPSLASKPMRVRDNIIFFVEDKESELGDYQLYVNGEWRKLYYDEKTNRLIYKILDRDKGKKSKVLLQVEDRVGNKNFKTMEILF